MAEHNSLGTWGEQQAVRFLEGKGYRIVETNWRHRRYEIDIIAEDQDELVFVEVKTRASNSLLPPEEAVDKKKIRHIVSAANSYMKQLPGFPRVRFDIIAICGENITHLPEAFYPPMGRSY